MKRSCIILFAVVLGLPSACFAQFGEKEDAQPVMQVYDVNDLMAGPTSNNPARKLSDLGDACSLFPEENTQDDPSTPTIPQGMQGMGQAGGRVMMEDRHENRADNLENLITTIVTPNKWSQASGPYHLHFFRGLMVVSAPRNEQLQIGSLLDEVRRQIASRKTVTVETHWLWLTEEQLRALAPESSGTVDEKAWKKHQELLSREDSELQPGYHAVLTCLNGQTVSTVAGRQRRFIISLIPVVGDDGSPATPNAPFIGGANGRSVGYQPQSTTVQEGVALQVRPILCGDDQVLLDIHGRVVEVETPDRAAASSTGQNAKKAATESASDIRDVASVVDRPVMNTSRIDTTLRMPLDARMLIGGITGSTQPIPDEPNLYLFAKVSVQKTANGEAKRK